MSISDQTESDVKEITGEQGRVLGVGGLFFRSPDPAALAAWYSRFLGLNMESWGSTHGTSFSPADMPENAFAVWSIFQHDTEYFGDRKQSFMFNLVVDNLEKALRRVALGGGEVLPEREDQDYGKFGWFIDPDGNRVELWEPPAATPEQAPDQAR
jgi:predicted enzyme related to lactoylglutathione lyase